MKEIGLIEIFELFWKRWILFLSVVVISGLAGFGFSFLLRPQYRTEALIRVPLEYNEIKGKRESVVPVSFYKEYFQSLNELLYHGNFPLLSRLTGINREELSSLSRLRIEIPAAYLINLKVEGYSPSSVYRIAESLIQRMKKIDGAESYLKRKRLQLEKYLSRLKDSIEYSKKLRNSNKVEKLFFDPALSLIEGEKEINRAELLLQNLSSMRVLIPPSLPAKPFKPHRIFWIFVFVMAGIFVDFIMAIYLLYREEKGSQGE